MALTQIINTGIGQVTDIKIGGSGSANTLDDYEEGTWTPTANAGVTGFTVQNAFYTKIGNLVTVNLYISGFTGASATRLDIGGLPFATKTGGYFAGSFESSGTGKMGIARGKSADTEFVNYYPNTSTALRTDYAGNDLGTHYIGSFTYQTT